MKTERTAKITAVALLTFALTPQASALPTTVQAESASRQADIRAVRRIDTYDECVLGKYEQGQIELLLTQIVNEDTEVTYTYEKLYDMSVNKIGYVVDFAYGDECGYLIMLGDGGSIMPQEVVLGQYSPYHSISGVYLYQSIGNYFVMADTGDNIQALNNGTYSNKDPDKGYEDYDLTYDYFNAKFDDGYYLTKLYAGYRIDFDDLDNYCANVAGVIALNYWNNYLDNKLLNLPTDQWSSNGMSQDYAEKYARIFYNYMKTNKFGGTGGTVPSDAWAGFARLIDEKGYKTYMTHVATYEEMKKQIDIGIPIFITSIDYYFSYDIYTPKVFNRNKQSVLVIGSDHYYGLNRSHTFIGYGYAAYQLYDEEGNLTTVDLIRAANGWGRPCYFNFTESSVFAAVAMRVSKC